MAWHSLLQGQLLISDTLKYNTRSQPEDNMCDLLHKLIISKLKL